MGAISEKASVRIGRLSNTLVTCRIRARGEQALAKKMGASSEKASVRTGWLGKRDWSPAE